MEGNGSVTSVVVGKKPHVPATLVILPTGRIPHKELAAEAGLTTDRGIQANDYLKTTDPNIYAVGDATEIQDVSTGKRPLSATWFNAVLQGRHAASNMTGERQRYTGAGRVQNAVQFHQLPAISCGQIAAGSKSLDDFEVLSMREGKKRHKNWFSKGIASSVWSL